MDYRYNISANLQEAFEFFNEELFKNRLPMVIITTQRHRGALGFFCPSSYVDRRFDEEGDMILPEHDVHEISIMPDNMYGRTDRQVLSTLVHEMCHLWQHSYGEPSRNGYHNKEWSEKMRAVGLEPSTVGEHDARNLDLPEDERKGYGEGSATGQHMSHFIIRDGRFDIACAKLLKNGYKIHWQQQKIEPVKNKKNKVKYTCPGCSLHAWGKPEIKLACGTCNVPMEQE